MSPSRLNKIDELNYLIKLHDVQYFKNFIECNRVSYRVAMFKAIESGSLVLADIVRWHHPHPEDEDIDLECLHAAFRGYLAIYESIPYTEEMEEFNSYRDNMYLCHGRFDKVNLTEVNMHDLLSPNIIPIEVCDAIISNTSCQRASIMTGALLIYCIHNSNHYTYLSDNPHIFFMKDMFDYATQHENDDLLWFLLENYKKFRQYTNFNIQKKNGHFNKERQYNGSLGMFDHYINDIQSVNTTQEYQYSIHKKNITLSSDMFEWQSALTKNEETDLYFCQVLEYVNRLIDQGIELKENTVLCT